MAKKKKKKVTKATKVAKVASDFDTAKSTPTQPPAVPEFEKGLWAGKVQYRCKLCPFDCLEDEGRLLTHLMEIHNSEVALEKILGDVPEPDPQSEVVMLREPEPDVEYFEVEVTDEELKALEENKDA